MCPGLRLKFQSAPFWERICVFPSRKCHSPDVRWNPRRSADTVMQITGITTQCITTREKMTCSTWTTQCMCLKLDIVLQRASRTNHVHPTLPQYKHVFTFPYVETWEGARSTGDESAPTKFRCKTVTVNHHSNSLIQ